MSYYFLLCINAVLSASHRTYLEQPCELDTIILFCFCFRFCFQMRKLSKIKYLCGLVQAAITNDHRLSGLNTKNVFLTVLEA